jgi:threonine/homoserine/homoserine lactone efflux protein
MAREVKLYADKAPIAPKFLIDVLLAYLAAVIAAQLASWLQRRPRVFFGLNLGAGITFIAAGLSILTLPRKA